MKVLAVIDSCTWADEHIAGGLRDADHDGVLLPETARALRDLGVPPPPSSRVAP